MNYQVTCICGNHFFINEQQVSKTVSCPVCKRELLPVISANGASSNASSPTPTAAAEVTDDGTPVQAAPAVAASKDATKRCPFCGEQILAIAKKCKHCGEFLDRSAPPPTASGMMPDVPPVFSLSVSQWDNFWKFLICIALAVLASGTLIALAQRDVISKEVASLGVPVSLAVLGLIAWMFYLSVKNSRCFVRPTRIDTEVGVLSKDITTVELFRITDIELKQTFLGRLLGIGTIRISSSDPKNPELILYQIPKVRRVHKYLQDQIPVATKQRGAIFYER